MQEFLDKLFENLEKIQVNLQGLMIDHLAYRARTPEEGDMLQKQWASENTLLNSVQINGRKVCIFEYSKPLEYQEWSIPCLELLYPRSGKTIFGWDHIEVVLGPFSDDLEILKQRVHKKFPQLILGNNEKYSYEEDGLHQVGDDSPNPCIEIRFPDNLGIKFHTADIRDIIVHQPLTFNV